MPLPVGVREIPTHFPSKRAHREISEVSGFPSSEAVGSEDGLEPDAAGETARAAPSSSLRLRLEPGAIPASSRYRPLPCLPLPWPQLDTAVGLPRPLSPLKQGDSDHISLAFPRMEFQRQWCQRALGVGPNLLPLPNPLPS